MKNLKINGFAIMLLSLILIVGFNSVGWTSFFDLDFYWQHIWMLLGIAGFFMAVRDDKRE